MLCGCIDIGSNTTRLLVAEVAGGELREVLARRHFTLLGRAIGADGRIDPDKVGEVARVVAVQAETARALGCRRLRVVGTAALRRAVNAAELAAAVSATGHVELEVLDSELEARLAFAGATARLAEARGTPAGVVDVGGGSCELAVGTVGDGVAWTASLPLGSGTLAEAHLHSDPPAPAELAAARATAAAAFAALDPPPVQRALAVGGSAGSLRRMAGAQLDGAAFERALGALCAEPADAVARRYGLEAERVRLLPAGLALLAAAAGVFGGALEVGEGGLREGVVLGAAG